ncbi:MAG: homocysteine biosynthesis protein [Cyanobacteriota bacterium]|nr:homocysteine biosynthesis protein [Cyanobacteriota bacterium]
MTPSAFPPRTEAELRRRQEEGTLRVRQAADFRALAQSAGLEEAYAQTDVVVAASAEFTSHASLHLSLGPTDPPMRLREVQVGGVSALPGGAGTDLVLPVAGVRLLREWLEGRPVDLTASGEGTPLCPRRELHAALRLADIGSGQLLLPRAITENGVVAISSAEGLLHTPYGAVLGPWVQALYTCSGADSIGLAMPGLAHLGPGSPVLVAGAVGWVVGPGGGHQPQPRRLPHGHARTPGAVAAVSVDLHGLQGRWLRAGWLEGHGDVVLVALAAPVPLVDGATAAGAATSNRALEAPVLDLAIPRRLKPSFGGVSYSALRAGWIVVEGRRLRALPAHSPRLAMEIGTELADRLRRGRFPLRLPLAPLGTRSGLRPLDP